MQRFRSDGGSIYDLPRPAFRRLRIYSLDPSLAQSLDTMAIRETRIEVPWELTEDGLGDGPEPGPRGEYLEVIDYDAPNQVFYKPVDLNDNYLLAQDGLPPSDGNPQFHQQMVYAVAMRTIRNFELALGRRALWAPRRREKKGRFSEEFVRRLRIYPHALREANAYYSPEKKALLFGYFPATPADAGQHMPGGMVFTCLSHDVVAHETAHALLDGMHRRLIEASNPDCLALHEAFADLVALLQHFSLTDVVRHVIGRTRGDLGIGNLLVELAQEFGRAAGYSGALRSAIGQPPDPGALDRAEEPHARGAILVAAVFDAFLAIYRLRTADLVRLATQGSGVLPAGEIHPDLVERLAREAAKSAQQVLNICIRALDYLPPVDVVFGDYLRALITADFDLVTDDRYGYRVAFIESFRRRGIYPKEVRSLSEESLRWEGPALAGTSPDSQLSLGRELRGTMAAWDLCGDRREIYENTREARKAVHAVIEATRDYKQTILKGVDLTQGRFEVHSLCPVRRIGPNGEFLTDVVLQVTQRRPGCLARSESREQCLPPLDFAPDLEPDFWFRGGCTLIFDLASGLLRYCIYKDINSQNRYERQRRYLESGLASGAFLRATYAGGRDDKGQDEVFALVHRGLRGGGA